MPLIRRGLQIPNFSFPGVAEEGLFETVASIARRAENAGFDTVLVMDHFYQLPALGPPDAYMLEAYTLLGALAASTERANLATLVAGNTYRNPALLAKMITTLDVVSRGRALAGVGAGWFEAEHRGYGFEYPPLGERLDRLEEALQIIHPMLRGMRPSFEGHFYRASEALNEPPPVRPGGPPILIGGTGERRTFRLVAEFADESNWVCPPTEFPRKLEALEKHCGDLGRDRASIGVSWLASLVLAPTREEAEAARDRFLAQRGIDFRSLPERMQRNIDEALVLGDPDTVGEFLQRRVFDAGLDGVIVNLPADAHEEGSVERAGELLRRVTG
jgi:F420-dependent oxidoreductase-like protein